MMIPTAVALCTVNTDEPNSPKPLLVKVRFYMRSPLGTSERQYRSTYAGLLLRRSLLRM